MKNFFQNLNNMFKRNSNGQENDIVKPEHADVINNEPVPVQEVAVPENLFVEKEPPVSLEQETKQSIGNKLSEFLKRDFRSIGYADGYRYHSSDVMDNYRRFIKSEFREVVDIVIDELKFNRLSLHKQLVDVRSFSSKTEEKFLNLINEVGESISRLEQEKELSSMDEGMVVKVLHQYRDGFIRGMEDHTDETLLMSYKGLFK